MPPGVGGIDQAIFGRIAEKTKETAACHGDFIYKCHKRIMRRLVCSILVANWNFHLAKLMNYCPKKIPFI